MQIRRKGKELNGVASSVGFFKVECKFFTEKVVTLYQLQHLKSNVFIFSVTEVDFHSIF